MPIKKVPLLDYWIYALKSAGIDDLHMNSHSHSEIVNKYLKRESILGQINNHYERKLLGTAGSLKNNINIFLGNSALVAHADNYLDINFDEFINFHINKRPKYCSISMMTFIAKNPQDCGIVSLDKNGVVREFYEKVENPPGDIANGAVYIFEPEVFDWINENNPIDISKDVIPNFLGKIATWNNKGIHIDIGTVQNLILANSLSKSIKVENQVQDNWLKWFRSQPVVEYISQNSNIF